MKKEKVGEVLGASLALLFGAYLIIGMPVWASLITGEPMYPGVLYAPVVELLGKILGS